VRRFSATATQILLLGTVCGVLYATAIAVSLGGAAHGDEIYHYAQIHLFRHGDFRVLDTYLTTIPGYHAVIAALMWLAGGLDSLGTARALNALIGLVTAAGFHALRRRLWPGTETLASAQFLALPILAPLFFLVYTDVLALTLVVWATVATLAQRHQLAALALISVVLVRQSDVVWAGFLALLAIWPLLRERGLSAWRELLPIALPYAAPIVLFLAFWSWNGSISLSHGQAALHPVTLRLGNPFFALFLAGVLLPLQVVAGLRRFGLRARAQPWLIVLPFAAFALYWFGFQADNPYNAALPDSLPRNAFLLTLDRDWHWRAAAGCVMVLAACGLAMTPLRPAVARWLYPVSAFFLASSWLIEQRYALVPLVLWLAFREQHSRLVEYATLALWLVLAVCMITAVVTGRFFL
jgi:alpha-1,2-glucosyltransferase